MRDYYLHSASQCNFKYDDDEVKCVLMNHFTDHVAYLKVRASAAEHLSPRVCIACCCRLLLSVRQQCINAENFCMFYKTENVSYLVNNFESVLL